MANSTEHFISFLPFSEQCQIKTTVLKGLVKGCAYACKMCINYGKYITVSSNFPQFSPNAQTPVALSYLAKMATFKIKITELSLLN